MSGAGSEAGSGNRSAARSRVLIAVAPGFDGERLDRFLVSALAPLSRNRVKALLDSGSLRIDGRTERRAGRLLRAGELIEAVGAAEALEAPAALEPWRIRYLDEHIVAVDKPAGLRMHAVEADDTHHLVAAVQTWAAATGNPIESGGPFLASRLDRETSGLVVMGRTREAGKRLTELFTSHETLKVYRAIVHGAPAEVGLIDTAIGDAGRGRQGLRQDGSPARTRFRVLARGHGESELEVRPETGRTHQIRVHLASIGHPLVGDLLYGGHRRAGVHRCLLHAERLELPHPITGAPLVLEAPLPPDLVLA